MAGWKPRIVVIGAGFGGIAAAVRMLQDGNDDLVVIDRADGVGGVWRANTYPGAECDVPSHLYSLSFHPKADWTHRYAGQDEILAYLSDVVSAHGVTPHLRLNTEVTGCHWDDAAALWRVHVRSLHGTAEILEADVVIAACGQLSRPAVPAIPGLDTFTGPAFHSAQWPDGIDLTGRRVAVIGTGASATQFVPHVAAVAAHVDVYQRSAPYIITKPDRPYRQAEKRAYATVPGLLKASRLRQYLWHEMLGAPFLHPRLMALPEFSWRRRLNREVTDLDLRARLTPDYRLGCKRLLRAPDWYATLTKDTVDVVTDDVAEVVPDGVRTADDTVRPADVVIFGTGFAATEFLVPMTVTGRDGRDLHAEWRDGARAHLGTALPGFPNFFLLYGPGTNLGHSSIVFMIESQLAWVRGAVRALQDLRWIEVRPEVQTAWDTAFRAASAHTVWETGCSSWYTVNGRNVNNWPGTTLAFRRRTRRFRLADVEALPSVPAERVATERVTASA